MKLRDMIISLQELEERHGGNMDVVIDTGMNLTGIEDIDLGASDEGVVIWCGDVVV